MRNLNSLNKFRMKGRDIIDLYGSTGNSENGVFILPSPIDGAWLRTIAAVGEGWEHVSVSRKNRCPNWPEMDYIKKIFFKEDETVMQLHVPPEDHVNAHPYCLHLWKPIDQEIPRPPAIFVGVK